MSDDEAEAPRHILNKINPAFDAATRSQVHSQVNDDVIAPATVRRRRGDVALAQRGPSNGGGGGFIPPSPPGGGFLVEDDESAEGPNTETATHIPLGKIPTALQMLDLPPADEDVLAVFRNAASGWDGSNDGQQGVSRKDWTSVCLILISQHEQPSTPSEDEDMHGGAHPQDESSFDDSDEYRNPDEHNWVEDEQSDEDDEDNYTQPSKRVADRKGKGKAVPAARVPKGKRRRKVASSSEDETPNSMTRRQKSACREAFALFFPDLADKDLDSQRIMIKDIVRVSGLVKEKMTAEEVLEMLSEFSTSPDKSVSLPDFERMMMVAKLA